MATDNSQNRVQFEALAERLVAETGISQAQARDLIALLGSDWSSLVREARLILRPRIL